MEMESAHVEIPTSKSLFQRCVILLYGTIQPHIHRTMENQTFFVPPLTAEEVGQELGRGASDQRVIGVPAPPRGAPNF
jgi:hypothetical protein